VKESRIGATNGTVWSVLNRPRHPTRCCSSNLRRSSTIRKSAYPGAGGNRSRCSTGERPEWSAARADRSGEGVSHSTDDRGLNPKSEIAAVLARDQPSHAVQASLGYIAMRRYPWRQMFVHSISGPWDIRSPLHSSRNSQVAAQSTSESDSCPMCSAQASPDGRTGNGTR
jgi:hypothetical protein